jgi:carboxypeptidase family protein/TonB-dependent receptor-like protein
MFSPKSFLKILLVLTIPTCFTPIVLAQSSTATLSGTVEDQNGAAIPAVTISLENVGTRIRREAATNENGYFTVPLLPPGEYTIMARATGFATVQIPNVVFNVGDQKSLQIAMKVGGVNAAIEVKLDETLVETSPAVGTVVDRQFVANLPLNGRSFQNLITLVPGVILVPSSQAGNMGQFSINGQRANANYFTVDGASANTGNGLNTIPGAATSGTLPGITTFGGTNSLVSVDALQEFQIQTSTYAAEYGRAPGGQISLVTRSGANDFHGSVFDYVRNDKFDANDWFANRARVPRQPERQNDFGGTFSGPVFLPRFGEGGRLVSYDGRNRTFFFFSYEGLRLRTPKFALTNVPSLSLRQQAAPGIQPFLRGFPIPNGRNLANGFAEFSSGYSDGNTLNATGIRIDHTINNRLTFFGRYNYAPSQSDVRDGQSNLSTRTVNALKPQTVTLGVTMVANPTITNELRLNFSENRGIFLRTRDTFGGAAPPPRELILLPQFAPEGTRVNGTISFFLTGLSTIFAPQISFSDQASSQRQFNLTNSLSVTAGSHQLKFGVDFRRLTPILSPRAYVPTLIFTSQANVLTGIAPTANFAAGLQTRPVYNELSFFAQDTWRVSRKLNLHPGIRWDLNPPPTEANGIDPPAINSLENLASLQLAPRGTPLWRTTYNNFAPRMGVAYQLFSSTGRETVVRGGFGVFFDIGNSQGSAGFGFFPFVPSRPATNVSLPLNAAVAAPPPFTTTPPYPTLATSDPNLKLPYTLQWSFGVEQSLGANQALTASYIGNVGRRLLVQRTLNLAAINPTFTTIRLVTNDATSDYHSLQVQFQRRLSKGLQARAAYTWSHAIDVVSSDALSSILLRGNSDFDIRHVLTGAMTYDLPQSNFNAFANAILRNWSIDSRFNAQTGLPLNIISGTITDPTDGTQISRRANLVEGVPVYLEEPTAPGGRVLNRAAFSTPAVGQQGSLGRNIIRGLPAWQVDLALRRRFTLTEKLNLQFRAEAFNLLNHPNFGAINTTLTSTTFGQATGMLGSQLSGLNPLFQVGGPRSFQFALRLDF